MRTKYSTNVNSYDDLHFTIYYSSRKKYVDTVQLTFGGYVKGEKEEFERNLKLHIHSLKQLIYRKHKDGYYRKRFILIEKITDSILKNKEGTLFFDLFLYLEETYEKDFVTEYLHTLMSDISKLCKENKFFKQRKYKNA